MPNSVSAPGAHPRLTRGPAGTCSPHNRGVASKNHHLVSPWPSASCWLAFIIVGRQRYRTWTRRCATAWPFLAPWPRVGADPRGRRWPRSPPGPGLGVLLRGAGAARDRQVSVAEPLLIVAAGLNFVTLVAGTSSRPRPWARAAGAHPSTESAASPEGRRWVIRSPRRPRCAPRPDSSCWAVLVLPNSSAIARSVLPADAAALTGEHGLDRVLLRPVATLWIIAPGQSQKDLAAVAW